MCACARVHVCENKANVCVCVCVCVCVPFRYATMCVYTAFVIVLKLDTQQMEIDLNNFNTFGGKAKFESR